MQQLVILVVAAAWVAVLIPPMLRSRIDNRPNSSVTDFRRQLNRLQSGTQPRGAARYMGRSLAQSSPLQRQAAPGRPGQLSARQGSLQRQSTTQRSGAARGGVATAPRQAEQPTDGGRYRSHGGSTGPQRRPARADVSERRAAERRSPAARHARTARAVDPAVEVKRRRTNVLFMLVVATACTMFLAATTSSTAMLYLFALCFLGLCGYVYLLAQIREREDHTWNNGWLEQH